MMGVVLMTAMAAFVSLAVDFGRVQLARSELQAAADAAALAATLELSKGSGLAGSAATYVLGANRADGVAIDSSANNVEYGYWNPQTNQFSQAQTSPNAKQAVRVRARVGRTNGAVPTIFASLLGLTSVTPTASAVATLAGGMGSAPGSSSSVYVPALSNVYSVDKSPNAFIYDQWGGEYLNGGPLWTPSGMSTYGSLAATSSGMPVYTGERIQITATGEASWQSWGVGSYAPLRGAEGDLMWSHGLMSPGNFPGLGIATVPAGALIAVFVDDNGPSGTAPPGLDFSTPTARNFSELSPQLNQVFFVGDGKDSSGNLQQFVVPPGATRLFFGFADAHCWRDNAGGFHVTTTKLTRGVALVR